MKENKPIVKGVIFDLDGTLVDTVEDLKDALNDTLVYHGLKPASLEQTKSWIGHGLKELIRKAFPDTMQDEDLIDQGHQMMLDNYKKRWLNKTRAYPEAEEVLKFLNDHNILIAVSSNKTDDAVRYIIYTLFDTIDFVAVKGLKEGGKRKPDPEQPLSIVEEMGIEPNEILYVGDSMTDYQTAKNTQMQSVLKYGGYGNQDDIRKVEDALHISNLNELKAFLTEEKE